MTTQVRARNECVPCVGERDKGVMVVVVVEENEDNGFRSFGNGGSDGAFVITLPRRWCSLLGTIFAPEFSF